MFQIILFIIIGLKLEMLHGWYLALLIILSIKKSIDLAIEFYKLGKEGE